MNPSNDVTPRPNIISTSEAIQIASSMRTAGRRLVVATGCFDLLHVGHVRLLNGARALGDALLVIVRSDRAVRWVKGPGRPVITQDERAEMLAALASVSYVTILDDVDADRLIAQLEPAVIARGFHPDGEPDVLADEADRSPLFGRVVLVNSPGPRTSGVIERVRQSLIETEWAQAQTDAEGSPIDVPTSVATPATPVDAAWEGTWTLEVSTPFKKLTGVLKFSRRDGTVTGEIASAFGTWPLDRLAVEGLSFKARVMVTVSGKQFDSRISGALDGDRITGQVSASRFLPLPSMPFVATRTTAQRKMSP